MSLFYLPTKLNNYSCRKNIFVYVMLCVIYFTFQTVKKYFLKLLTISYIFAIANINKICFDVLL